MSVLVRTYDQYRVLLYPTAHLLCFGALCSCRLSQDTRHTIALPLSIGFMIDQFYKLMSLNTPSHMAVISHAQ